jgi:hypothetical protein
VLEERAGYRLYECFIDGTFAKAQGGGHGVGLAKVGRGVKMVLLVDARRLPVAIDAMSKAPHESRVVRRLLDLMLSEGSRRVRSATRPTVAMSWRWNWRSGAWNRSHRSVGGESTRTGTAGRCGGTNVAGRWSGRLHGFNTFWRLCVRWEKCTRFFQGFPHRTCVILLMRRVWVWALLVEKHVILVR